MDIRLNKVMATLNIGLNTVYTFLQRKPELGSVENLTINSIITDEQYDALKKKYKKDGAINKNAGIVFSTTNEHKNKKVKKKNEENTFGLKIPEKKDLNRLNQKPLPLLKSKAEQDEEKTNIKELQNKEKKNEKIKTTISQLKYTRHQIIYKHVDGIFQLNDKRIKFAFNKCKSKFFKTIVELCLDREKRTFTFSNPNILNQIIFICQNEEKEKQTERKKEKSNKSNAIKTILQKTQETNSNLKEIQLTVAVSEIKLQGLQAFVTYNDVKYSSIVTKSDKRLLMALNRELRIPILLNLKMSNFKFGVSLNSLLPKTRIVPKTGKEQRTMLEIDNVEFHDHYYLIWIIRQGKKDTSITPLKVADSNSLHCLRLIQKYFSERFPKGIEIIYDSQRVISLTQVYILSSYIKVLNANIYEHGEWWKEIQNDRKLSLAMCRKTSPTKINREMALKNCYLDYLSGMPNQKTVIKVYEVRQNQQEDVFIFTINIGKNRNAIIFENISYTATATWVFIVKDDCYEECVNRIFDYFTNYEVHNKRKSLIKSINPPQKFKAEDYYKIKHDETKGWMKRLNDILVREIPSNRIQFNQGLHIAEETDFSSGSPEKEKILHLHNELMRRLYHHLCQQYGEENIGTENHIGTKKIDVVAKTEDGYNIYEIKTDKEPRSCVREAMGQILDYAFFECKDVIHKMVIVGVTPETKEVNTYLTKFREKNSLEIYYTAI